MVSTYYLVKLFRKAAHERLDGTQINEKDSPVTPQQDTNTCICRICLKNGNISIYNNQGRDISVDICTFGDVVISENDGHPKFICKSCHKLLEAAVLFRITAKRSDEILKNSVPHNRTHSNKSQDSKSGRGTVEKSTKSSTAILKSFFSAVVSDDNCSLSDSKPSKSKKKVTKVQCRICFKIISKAYYKEHFALHDQTVVKYVCDICGKSFRQRCSYRNHYFTHSSSFPYKCKLCSYRGRNTGLLKNHMRTHTRDYRYMCTECPARFVTKSNLNKHSQKHKEPMFKCDNCQRGFHSQLILERHFEADHLGIKNHICTVCGKAFGYRKAMMRHQLDVHKREKRANGRTPAYIEAEMKKVNDNVD